jgi:hypothetical protein
VDSTGVKRSEYLKNVEQNVGIDYQSYFEGKNVVDLLDIGGDSQPKGGLDELLSGSQPSLGIGSLIDAPVI